MQAVVEEYEESQREQTLQQQKQRDQEDDGIRISEQWSSPMHSRSIMGSGGGEVEMHAITIQRDNNI